MTSKKTIDEAVPSKIVCLSLGAGVQSSTLLMMAESGELGARPDLAVFADTGWEPKEVYANLEYLRSMTSIPIVTVSVGNVRDLAVASKDSARFHSLPMHGERGLLPRHCTGDFKVKPIQNHLMGMLGRVGRERLPADSVELWIGISYDEVQRMKPSGRKWIVHRWPLIEKRMTRADCLHWMKQSGFNAPPRSSCIGCPFHRDEEWAKMKAERPEDFTDAVRFDAEMRTVGSLGTEAYLHRSRKPLGEIDFVEVSKDQLFFDECEGFCHV
jgi:hypothetical protein